MINNRQIRVSDSEQVPTKLLLTLRRHIGLPAHGLSLRLNGEEERLELALLLVP